VYRKALRGVLPNTIESLIWQYRWWGLALILISLPLGFVLVSGVWP
jgi:hypothetical protein